MKSLNIDFRDNCLRILVVKDGQPIYSNLITNFPSIEDSSAKESLENEIKKAGGKGLRANVVLPSNIVNYRTYAIPSMDIEDTQKIIKREIAKELKGQSFTFGIKRISKRTPDETQEILAEYVIEADVMKYFNLLKTCGTKPQIISSSLEGNTFLFNKLHHKTDSNEALIDIGKNVVEVSVFNNKRLLMYEQLLIQYGQDEGSEEKMKVFKILDTLYKFLLSYSKKFPEKRLSLLWICGIGSLSEDITTLLSDGLGVKTTLLSPFEITIEKESAFSAVAGLSTIPKSEKIINFIPLDVLEKKRQIIKNSLLAALLSIYVMLLIGGYSVLKIVESDLKQTYDNLKSHSIILKSRQETENSYYTGMTTYKKLISGSPNLYGVFRDIANLTPSSVTIEGIEIENSQDKTNLKISAKILYRDKNLKNSVLSNFLTSLEGSSRLRLSLPPEISVVKTKEEKEISIITRFQVL